MEIMGTRIEEAINQWAILRLRLLAIMSRAEALKINHPEWSNIIDATVHPEDFELALQGMEKNKVVEAA